MAIRGIGGSSPCLGIVDVLLRFNGRSVVCRFGVYEVNIVIPPLIGNMTLHTLGISVENLDPKQGNQPRLDPDVDDRTYLFPEDQPSLITQLPPEVQCLINENASIPVGNSCSHPLSMVDVNILPGKERPVHECERQFTQAKKVVVQGQVETWVNEDVIERNKFESLWNLNLVVAHKKDAHGNHTGYRVCLDPRIINNITPDDTHALPLIFDHLDEACAAKIFSSINLYASFHQFRVSHRSC